MIWMDLLQSCFISAEDYLEKALALDIEERFGKLESLFPRSKLDHLAVSTDYHLKIDASNSFLDKSASCLYQSYVGILRWQLRLQE